MPTSDVMTADVSVVRSDQSIRDAARLMADLDAGVVPVGENDRLVGMLTDRDITVRAVAAGKGPDTPIREAMTTEVRYCYADEDCAAVAQTMGELQIRRLPVLDRDKRLVGIVSLGDLSTLYSSGSAGSALGYVSEQSGS
ncbi:CBS domain-containing protein [Methylobacterium sp.]|uniref:CBS domain-containing protein n=1 Tax=Methylobacterium sp. TaxID=409 RepID=UPI003B00DB95